MLQYGNVGYGRKVVARGVVKRCNAGCVREGSGRQKNHQLKIKPRKGKPKAVVQYSVVAQQASAGNVA